MKRSGLLTITLVVMALASVLGAGALVRDTRAPASEVAGAVRKISHGERYAREGRWIGGARAPLRLVEFSDFECPYCKHLHQTLESLQVAHPGAIGVVFRHYPSRDHFAAGPAAIASECAAEQGRFAEFAHVAFAAQDSLGLIPWPILAARARVPDVRAFATCLSGSTVGQHIERDLRAGDELHVTGTPAILIGDSLFIGDLAADELMRKLGSSPR